MSHYALPPLPYAVSALEPHISRRVLALHHGTHHAQYVHSANVALDDLARAREREDFSALPALERALAFHLSGHILHAIYWQNLSPQGGGEPDGELADAIRRDLGSFDMFRRQMTQAAATVMGSGWSALVWEPLARRLLVTQIYDHQSNLSLSSVPIMVMDAWEHAFYLQYENRKAEHFEAIWNLWNWQDVQRRFSSVRTVDVRVPGAIAA
jgi:Fe-Mn family superoxide dismutase